MPQYLYLCSKCRKTKEIIHRISECDSPSQEIISQITCHGGLMRRIPQETLLNGATGKTEGELLDQKQKQSKARSAAATAQAVESNSKDVHPEERDRLKEKYSSKKFEKLKGNPFAKGK